MNYPLYIHIPYCLSKCDYCDFFSVPVGSASHLKNTASSDFVPDDYVDALCNEILYRKEMYDVEKWSSIYIGGGTPSLLSFRQVEKIAACLSKSVLSGAEFTLEANPVDISQDFLQCLSDCGVNRLSLGIQSFDDASLSCVKRRSGARDVKNSLGCVKKYWNGEFSADLISALPFQTTEVFLTGLGRLLEYEPHHISLYSLAIEEETPLFKMIESKEIPYDYETADSMWLLGKETLERSGWISYEISNFYNRKNGRPCFHNMAYWKMKSYIGAGSGGTGSVYGKKSIRYTNSRNLAKYIDFWKECGWKKCGGAKIVRETDIFLGTGSGTSHCKIRVPEDIEVLEGRDEEVEFFMMGLRLYEGICIEEFEGRFSKKIPDRYCAVMDSWRKRGHAEYYTMDGKKYFCLTKEGILFLNGFMKEIMDVS